MKTLDVNVIGTLYFSRIAAVFLREGRRQGEDRSLVLLSSVNAFRESPGLYIYQVRSTSFVVHAETNCIRRRAESTSSKASCAHRGNISTSEMASESMLSVPV